VVNNAATNFFFPGGILGICVSLTRFRLNQGVQFVFDEFRRAKIRDDQNL
jgi:hypothetical protein